MRYTTSRLYKSLNYQYQENMGESNTKQCYSKICAVIAIVVFGQLTAVMTFEKSRQTRDSQHSSSEERIGTSSGLKTPDDFLQEIFPLSDINIVWQEIIARSKLTGGDYESHEPVPLQRAKYERQIMFEQMRSVTCGTPQSVVLDAYKELGYTKGLQSRIFPDCVRAKRCRNSGCCSDGFGCKVNQTDTVERTLLVFDGSPQANVAMRTHSIVNHVSCKCVPYATCTNQKECRPAQVWNTTTCSCDCRNKCPVPFIQDQTSCQCECPHSNSLCLDVFKGVKKLPREQCKSVEDSAVQRPPCEHDKQFYTVCCRCMKRPCLKTKAKLDSLAMQGLSDISATDKDSIGSESPDSFSSENVFSSRQDTKVNIVTQSGEDTSSGKKQYKYTISGPKVTQEKYSSDDSSEG